MTLPQRTLRTISCAVLAAGLLVCSTASAEGWGLPSLNPFATKKAKAPTSARVSDSGSGFSLLPKWGTSTSKQRSSGPSTWSRMTSAINPWSSSKSTARPEPSPTGSFNPFTTASTKKQEAESSSFLPSWLGGGDEKKTSEPKTVNDFLKQEKLDF